ncbi:hypothetical protein ACIB24_00200 [Spongisporangium articulatum]|uniref:Uncharacterized protein n=1 Tax=Spongisporangium articulatum TaxID=3362603 RepID=A0ABW8AGI8_9ACTN
MAVQSVHTQLTPSDGGGWLTWSLRVAIGLDLVILALLVVLPLR